VNQHLEVDENQRSFDDTLELIANLIYLSRHAPLGSSRQSDYLDRAVEAITRNRDRRAFIARESALNGS
jgi:hypothetical protein